MEQGSQEWHDLRRTRIGSSDAPIIMGASPWKTAYELWFEKVTGATQEQTPAMARGVALEESARQRFQEKMGIMMMPKVVVSQKNAWQMASLDGISFDGTSILEIKHANREVFERAKQGDLPDYYNIQIQHALDTTGAAKCYYVVSDGEKDAYVEVFPDQDLIKEIREENEKFYEYLMSKEPPPLTDKDYVVIEDKEFIDLMLEYKDVKHELDILKDCEQVIREKLIALAKNKNAICTKGKMTKSFSKGQVDMKLVPELIGVNLEPYRKPPCEKWRITVINEDGA